MEEMQKLQSIKFLEKEKTMSKIWNYVVDRTSGWLSTAREKVAWVKDNSVRKD